MVDLPPIPSWDALHPLVIHFPIALLLVAPLFLVIGAVARPERGRPYLVTALILMASGTIGTWVAVATGKAAGELVERTAQVNAVLEHHEELADTTRAVFTVLTLIFATILFVPALFQRQLSRLFSTALPLVFVIAYAAGSVILANTAHNGGRLVHELGTSSSAMAEGSASMQASRGGERND